MRASYEIIERPTDGLRLVLRVHPVFGDRDQALWSLGRLRKPTACAVTRRALDKGEMAWRPVGNQGYRKERISEEALR